MHILLKKLTAFTKILSFSNYKFIIHFNFTKLYSLQVTLAILFTIIIEIALVITNCNPDFDQLPKRSELRYDI